MYNNNKPMKTQLSFYECEHDGDLENYISDVHESGGTVIARDLNYEAEIGTIVVDHDEKFMDRFKETDAYQFLD